jgi:hypothetical protein
MAWLNMKEASIKYSVHKTTLAKKIKQGKLIEHIMKGNGGNQYQISLQSLELEFNSAGTSKESSVKKPEVKNELPERTN